jgi:glycosyltransferase involved in cell wall biosynthesis
MTVSELRVLIWAPEVGQPFGGQIVQLEMTASHLRDLGVEVDWYRGETPDLTGVTVVHGYNLNRQQIRVARTARVPICLSTVYWSKAYMTGQLTPRTHLEEIRVRARAAAVLGVGALRGRHVQKSLGYLRYEVETRACFEAADMLFPNSLMEAEQIILDLDVTTPVHIVPNGVDPALFTNTTPWDQRAGVLSVGRIEPHKNQLRLIEALAGTGIPLTLVGEPHPHHPRYVRHVERAVRAAGNVDLVPRVDHGELAAVYNRHRAHALPSGFETTGLVSLEAALCGCNIVTTDVGYAREYLDDDAGYCDPYDIGSIRAAVVAAVEAPAPDSRLADRIRDRYTWRRAAEETLEAYQQLAESGV